MPQEPLQAPPARRRDAPGAAPARAGAYASDAHGQAHRRAHAPSVRASGARAGEAEDGGGSAEAHRRTHAPQAHGGAHGQAHAPEAHGGTHAGAYAPGAPGAPGAGAPGAPPGAPPGAARGSNDPPDRPGRFGPYGGRYVAETLAPALARLEAAWREAEADPAFGAELERLLRLYAGRPSPLFPARRFAALLEERGARPAPRVWFKRDELNHTGSHKINNVLGQVLLARRMGARRVVAETGAGQHGVATATACALFGLPCAVHMGARDIERQAPNAFRMRLLGAEVIPAESGSATLKDAMNEALRDWTASVGDTFYVIGSVAGPSPYPEMVRSFQRVIGEETRAQLAEQEGAGALPDLLVACVGGGSNAIGLFADFLGEPGVRMVGVEAGGEGPEPGRNAAALAHGVEGVLHGARSVFLQDGEGQILEAHSVSAGLDYPGVGPEHARLRDTGRVEYASATDAQALEAFRACARSEGILPAFEPAHALAWLLAEAPRLGGTGRVVVNLCGRGDKDVFAAERLLGKKTP